MKVADLKRYFTDLAALVNAADGRKSGAELLEIAKRLEPFADYGLLEFGDFLTRAEHYHRTGLVIPGPPKGAAKPKAPAKPKADVSALHAEVEHVYRSSASPHVTVESIEELGAKLSGLNKDQLASIAQAVELVGMGKKTKGAILEAIIARIRSIKQSAVRTSIID